MQTNIVSNVLVVSPRSSSDQGILSAFDQEGNKILDYTLEKQTCEPGAIKEFVR